MYGGLEDAPLFSLDPDKTADEGWSADVREYMYGYINQNEPRVILAEDLAPQPLDEQDFSRKRMTQAKR